MSDEEWAAEILRKLVLTGGHKAHRVADAKAWYTMSRARIMQEMKTAAEHPPVPQ
jgi:hypothetical protein